MNDILKQNRSVARRLEMQWAMRNTLQNLNEITEAIAQIKADGNFKFSPNDIQEIADFVQRSEQILQGIKKQ